MSLSSIHRASLIDNSAHSAALLQLIESKVSRVMTGEWSHTICVLCCPEVTLAIVHLAHCVAEAVSYAMARQSTRPPCMTGEFITFVQNIIARAQLAPPVLITSLVYIERAKQHLYIGVQKFALERVFLGAVITASKVSTFFSPKHITANQNFSF
jgi:Cyclin, N-terminal domain